MISQILTIMTEHTEDRPKDHRAPDRDQASAPRRRPASLALQLATYSGPAAAMGMILLVAGLLALIAGIVLLFAGLIGALIGD